MTSSTLTTVRQRSADNETLSAPDPLSHLTPASRRDFWAFGFGATRPLSARAIHHPVEAWARSHPDAPALRDATGRELSYAELDREATAVAAELRRLGVAQGDRVGVFLSRGADLVIAILATLKCGAAWVPQDIRLTRTATLEHIVTVAEIDVVLTTSAHRDAVPEIVPNVVAVDQIDTASTGDVTALAGRAVRGDDVAVVIFTSGTTGVPNGVEVTHANLVNTILEGPAALGIQPRMRVAQLLNIAFDMAVWEIFGALTHGASLEMRGADIEAAAARSNVLIATPSVLARINPDACPEVAIVAVAGERCPQTLADAWSSRAVFHNSCGPTEVSIVNTVHRLGEGEELSIGAPIPNTTVYVLDEQQRPVETGQVGEMWAGGACVTRGYLGNPTLTAERYRHDPFTGGMMFRCRDLVSWTPQGRLLHHGRTDDQVKVRGGFRVELDAITNAMEAAPEVHRGTTIHHEGELIGVVTASEPMSDDVVIEAARAAVVQRHAYFYVPQRILVVDELPLTDRGKVDKRALLAQILTVPAQDTTAHDTTAAAATTTTGARA